MSVEASWLPVSTTVLHYHTSQPKKCPPELLCAARHETGRRNDRGSSMVAGAMEGA